MCSKMSEDHSHRFNPHRKLTKVAINLPPCDWHSHALETLWAEPLGDHKYRLQNVPFYASGLSYEDVVTAEPVGDQIIMQSVVDRGGHSTYRLYLSNGVTVDSEAFTRHWRPLQSIGATFEQANERLFAVDIPRTTDIYEAYALMQAGEENNVWDFQEGHCGHPLRR